MIEESVFEEYLKALVGGDRKQSRSVIERVLQSGVPANSVYVDVIWPVMVEIEKLRRSERITPVQEHLATRINRTIVDQLQNKLPRRPDKNRKIVVCCAQDELQELGAQMMVDLFESDGWEVKFPGGGLNNDDILAFANEYGPDILLIYGTEPRQAPQLRRLIDTIKGVAAWPGMRIMVSGGVFGRAEGLWEEIGADLYAETPVQALSEAWKDKSESTEETGQKSRRKKRQRPVGRISAQVA
jgi:methanogenic corrinoid protein MtbC1